MLAGNGKRNGMLNVYSKENLVMKKPNQGQDCDITRQIRGIKDVGQFGNATPPIPPMIRCTGRLERSDGFLVCTVCYIARKV